MGRRRRNNGGSTGDPAPEESFEEPMAASEPAPAPTPAFSPGFEALALPAGLPPSDVGWSAHWISVEHIGSIYYTEVPAYNGVANADTIRHSEAQNVKNGWVRGGVLTANGLKRAQRLEAAGTIEPAGP